ncbi:TetR/AcrR family transcriptional regulator [Polymorphobacter sp. PAMC 29334]|uniref:TetR/AcrR family transcriptional regulator n=1 Tax=Polymorphobacter sp. PAMC 29334 TaxID=2862331 RepID=UPI001C66B9D5|nr:TetR/AcrR family transcriptional regulator [Polymorphobacter sp. PAMC 29334]QYE33924.1 TetR/AcrR family transcriptional regulator [Polymorphobacter sp. PAMC 29334]
MRYDSEHKAQTRERVLKEAAAVIRSEGVDRLGVAQVMARAGLTHGGFYAHFASKDDLVTQAIEYMFEDRYAAFFANLADADPRVSLTRFVDRYLSMRHRNAPKGGCPLPVLAGQVPQLPEAARARFRLALSRLNGGVASLLERMGVSDVELIAAAVISEMVGAVAIARVEPDDVKAEQLLGAVRASVATRLGLAASS